MATQTEALEMAQEAITQLSEDNAKLAAMAEEAQAKALSEADIRELDAINTEIVSKLASAGQLGNITPAQAVLDLRNPIALADMLHGMIVGQGEPPKQANAPTGLGSPSSKKAGASAESRRVETRYRPTIRP